MGLQENMAATMRAVMERKHKSLAEFSEELEISRTALYDYLNGRGNPSAATIEHIAGRLNLSPAALITGLLDLDHLETALLLLDTIQVVSELPDEQRVRFAELFLELVSLMNKKADKTDSGGTSGTR